MTRVRMAAGSRRLQQIPLRKPAVCCTSVCRDMDGFGLTNASIGMKNWDVLTVPFKGTIIIV